MPVLFGAGPIAAQESALIIEAVLLMLVVVVPVLMLLFFFAWRYRKGGRGRYQPHWEHSRLDELVWWAVPIEIILVLGALTWQSTHVLDPHKPLPAPQGQLEVEVVALPWKWLFIYPAQGIATVNFAEIPAGVPVHFSITADAPMNSFWIPALGGQIYAMTGMVNPLYLEADTPGMYQGVSSNYSGTGFADMHFVVHARTPADFADWMAAVKSRAGSAKLDAAEYQALSYPATSTTGYYGSVDPALFDSILQSYDWGFLGGHHH